MKTVKQRAFAALVLVFALLLGLGVYVWRFAQHGAEWAGFGGNPAIYSGGRLTVGTVTDRNGLVLADAEDGTRTYASDPELRLATLHAVGDASGNIGTGALTAFAAELGGYSPVTGVSSGGGAVALSLDAELCRTAWSALAGRKGAVLLSDYSTGEILCMVSSPSYDPEVGFDAADPWYEGVFLNRCISAAYTPGSVFKLVTLAAALENIPELGARTFSCTGSTTVDGNAVNCTGVHGEQTIEQALANSCNCAFAALSLELGGETLARYAEALGLTRSLSVSGIACSAGSFSAYPDGSADLAWSGIGQSTDLVCPLAMLRLVSAIAGDGKAREPVLLQGQRGTNTRLLRAETAQALRDMMSYNVVSAYGAWNFPGLNLCAKSGTAETGSGTSHAWFVGFLDDPDRPYAFTVILENAGGGLTNAGPVANALLQAAVSRADES